MTTQPARLGVGWAGGVSPRLPQNRALTVSRHTALVIPLLSGRHVEVDQSPPLGGETHTTTADPHRLGPRRRARQHRGHSGSLAAQAEWREPPGVATAEPPGVPAGGRGMVARHRLRHRSPAQRCSSPRRRLLSPRTGLALTGVRPGRPPFREPLRRRRPRAGRRAGRVHLLHRQPRRGCADYARPDRRARRTSHDPRAALE